VAESGSEDFNFSTCELIWCSCFLFSFFTNCLWVQLSFIVKENF